MDGSRKRDGGVGQTDRGGSLDDDETNYPNETHPLRRSRHYGRLLLRDRREQSSIVRELATSTLELPIFKKDKNNNGDKNNLKWK